MPLFTGSQLGSCWSHSHNTVHATAHEHATTHAHVRMLNIHAEERQSKGCTCRGSDNILQWGTAACGLAWLSVFPSTELIQAALTSWQGYKLHILAARPSLTVHTHTRGGDCASINTPQTVSSTGFK